MLKNIRQSWIIKKNGICLYSHMQSLGQGSWVYERVLASSVDPSLICRPKKTDEQWNLYFRIPNQWAFRWIRP